MARRRKLQFDVSEFTHKIQVEARRELDKAMERVKDDIVDNLKQHRTPDGRQRQTRNNNEQSPGTNTEARKGRVGEPLMDTGKLLNGRWTVRRVGAGIYEIVPPAGRRQIAKWLQEGTGRKGSPKPNYLSKKSRGQTNQYFITVDNPSDLSPTAEKYLDDALDKAINAIDLEDFLS